MPEATDNIGLIVLAAGYSKRFGHDKRQAIVHNGQTLLDATLSRLPASFSRRILVLHPGDEEFATKYSGQKYSGQWTLCFAAKAAAGMGHSLAAAMQFTSGWAGAVIALGDMPYVQPDTYRAVQEALLHHPIVRPCCQGRVGNPAGLRSDFFPALKQLDGDAGARVLFQQHHELVHLLPCQDQGIIKDVDSLADLAASSLDSESWRQKLD